MTNRTETPTVVDIDVSDLDAMCEAAEHAMHDAPVPTATSECPTLTDLPCVVIDDA